MPITSRHFNKGDKIEVLRDDTEGLWFPATVLRSSENRKGKIYVEFETLTTGENRLREYVTPAELRPVPPQELHSFFKVGDIVDAYSVNAWCRGEVKDILENSMYCVSFGGKVSEIEQWNLRPHRDWDDGSWVPPLAHQEKSSELEVRSRELKLRIKFSGRTPQEKFGKGTVVEVKSDEEGYQGSWYTAVIVGLIRNDKFLVEYQTLKTNDETELLKEEADVSCIRPLPPESQGVDHFDQLEQVDAWYNDGWWVGHISKVLDGLKYIVCFKTTNEEMMFDHSKLRPHQEWVNDRWVAYPKESQSGSKSKELKLKIKFSKTSDPKFSKGTVVEVKSDEEGYQGSWFTAVIVGSIGTDKFLVEYQTLKTDDESQPLIERADASYIRPCPPEIQRVDRFRLLEEVDAWYNDGWWVGLICRVLGDLKYSVYFWTTNEEIEFQHFKLRPHQEWADGKWIVSFRKMSKMLVKLKLAKPKRRSNGTTSIPFNGIGTRSIPFNGNGTKVEVQSDEDGQGATWYPAISLGPIASGKYLVEYKTLKADNEVELLKEEVDFCSIRPCPPIIQRSDQYKTFDEIDAWYNYGWWVGQVSKVLGGSKYKVYFKTINEVLEFQHCNLRPHQDWDEGKWTPTIRGRSSNH